MDGKDVQKILGMSVKELRLAKGLTQERLAELINKLTFPKFLNMPRHRVMLILRL